MLGSSFHWFSVLSTSFVIGQSNYFSFGFRIVVEQGCFTIMPKIPKISVGIQMEDPLISVGLNIPTEIRRSIFNKPVLCPNKGIRTRNKKW